MVHATVETVYYRMRELYTAKYHVIHSLITCHHGNANIYHMTARANQYLYCEFV